MSAAVERSAAAACAAAQRGARGGRGGGAGGRRHGCHGCHVCHVCHGLGGVGFFSPSFHLENGGLARNGLCFVVDLADKIVKLVYFTR